MRSSLAMLMAVTSIAVATTPSVASSQTADERKIRDLESRQADAWNRHDARAYAALFTTDGDVVNVVGWWWKGRPEIRESTMSITDVNVRFLSKDVAIAHVQWTMAGSRMPPGMPEPGQGIQLQVLQKSAGQWLIASFQNTNSVPERPFPTPGAELPRPPS